MLTEGYNGVCSLCGYERMLIRYGSRGWLQYDACPRCKFCYGSNDVDEWKGKELWKLIIESLKTELKEKALPLTVEGIFQLVESLEEPQETFAYGTVFDYKHGER